jgi:hypothetical protein
MTRQEAAKLITVMFAACPAQASKLDERRKVDMVDAYATLLEDVTYEAGNTALRVLLQTRTWMPSVADIRSTVREMQVGPVKTGAEAWGSVMRAMREKGFYRTPGIDFYFNDPVTARVVAALGWGELCSSENAVADRARFIDAYDVMTLQDRKEQLAPALSAARETREALTAGQAVNRVLKLYDGDS